MSLDQRCQLFHDAAMGTGKSKGPLKEIATLHKFLHKNQDQRFTDKAVSRLFDTIQIYASSDAVAADLKDGLLEDALKMPFTVFSTKQKKTMIKWLEDSRGTKSGISAEADDIQTCVLSVIDLNDDTGKLSLMNDETGDTYDDVTLPEGDIGVDLCTAFDNTEGVVQVKVQMSNERISRFISIEADS